MSETGVTYEVIFRGDIVLGETMVDVKQRVAELFKLDADRIEQLFSGRPVVLKKNLDEQKAKQYQQVLEQAGAVAQVNVMGSGALLDSATEPSAPESSSEAVADSSGLTVSEVGVDILAPSERREFLSLEIELDHLSLGEVGDDVLADEDKKPFAEKNIDTSHLSLDEN